MIDLGKIDTVKGSNEGFDVELYHPGTNADLGIVITVLGKDSDEFQKITRQQNKKRMDRMSKNGFRSGKVAPPSQDELDSDNLDVLSGCTTGWKTLEVTDKDGEVVESEKDTITLAGDEVAFSCYTAKILYSRFPWIKEQIDIAIGDRANFIKA